jgi:hypothetical protein
MEKLLKWTAISDLPKPNGIPGFGNKIILPGQNYPSGRFPTNASIPTQSDLG